MEKVIAYQLNESQLEIVYKACSQMRIGVILVDSSHSMSSLEDLTKLPVYKGNTSKELNNVPVVKATIGSAPALLAHNNIEESLLVMCELREKHMDRLLATLRMTNAGIDYKAVLTPTNAKWNLIRVLAEMELEKRAWEAK